MQRSDLKPGQQVFVARIDEYMPGKPPKTETRTITKVGLKWAELGGPTIVGGNRFEIATGGVDRHGFVPIARVWLSEQDWLDDRQLRKAWRAIVQKLQDQSHPPQGLTLANVFQVAHLLGVQLETERTDPK